MKINKKLLFLVCILMSTSAFAQTVTQQWAAHVFDGRANDVETDSSGNVYITGTTAQGMTTVKYNSAGAQLWLRNFRAGPLDEALDLELDGLGNVYITGFSGGVGTGGAYGGVVGSEITTIKYDTNGNQLWLRTFSGNVPDSSDQGADLQLDSAGNVYVVGHTQNLVSLVGTPQFPGQVSSDITLLKYSNSGAQLWNRYVNGNAAQPDDRGLSLATDTAGNVYITGETLNAGTNIDITTAKFDSAGNQLWKQTFTSAGANPDRAFDIEVDSSGNSHVTGTSLGAMRTIKYSTAGTPLWTQSFSAAGGNAAAKDVETDSSGNVLITGFAETGPGQFAMQTVKYSSAGALQWSQQAGFGTALFDDFPQALDLEVDSLGNVYVTGQGQAFGPAGSSLDITTVKYTSTGFNQWTQTFSGPSSDSADRGNALALDGAGNVYVTGYSEEFGMRRMTTIKYSQASQAVCGNGAVESGEQCDRGSLNGQFGTCCTTSCTFTSAATQCRTSAGPCDRTEFCTGTSSVCPANSLQPAGTTCRASAGSCDTAETCTGNSTACPTDTYATADTLCRPSAGECDESEFCTGSGPACPNDLLKQFGAPCTDTDENPCTTAGCPGTSQSCDQNNFFNDGFQQPCTVPGLFGPCALGVKTCSSGMFSFCQQTTFPADEGPFGSASCADGTDNDCDGLTDADDPNCQRQTQTACQTTLTDTANAVGKNAPFKKTGVQSANAVMLPKSAVQQHCNLLDAECVWANLASINTAGDPVVQTDANGNAVLTSSVADPDGWAIYVNKLGANAAGYTITGGTTQTAVSNSDCAPHKQIQEILSCNAGTCSASNARQSQITGSLLEILYPESAIWDEGSSSYLYPFIMTSDSVWTVDVCAQVPRGYEIFGVYNELGQLISASGCAQSFVEGQTKVVAFDVAKTGSPPEWALNAKLRARSHKGKVTTLDLNVPTKVLEKSRGKPFSAAAVSDLSQDGSLLFGLALLAIALAIAVLLIRRR